MPTSGRRGLQRHDTVVLHRGKEHGAAAREELGDFVVRAPAEELHGGSRERAQAALLGPGAHDEQPALQTAGGRHRKIHTLVGHEGGHDQVELARALHRLETLRRHRRVDDVGASAVDATDAVGDVMGDGHEVVHAVRAPVEAPQRSRHRRHEGAREAPGAGAEVIVVQVPHVTHGSEAVRQVQAAGRHPHGLGHAMAQRQDQVVTAHVETAHGGGEQGQVIGIRRAGGWQRLDERGHDPAPLDRRRHGTGYVEQREERRGREELTEDFQAPLAAAHAGEPVVNDGDSRRARPLQRRSAYGCPDRACSDQHP